MDKYEYHLAALTNYGTFQCLFGNFTIFSGDIETGKKLHTIPGGRKGTEAQHVGHTAHILCMAISSDGKYLVNCPSSVYAADCLLIISLMFVYFIV